MTDELKSQQQGWVYPLKQRYRVTQRFGARPWYYRKWGLPGHEGIDIGAPPGDPVFAMRDGTIRLVHRIPYGHPYGLHVRIDHIVGDAAYETIYAHLGSLPSDLQVGDFVAQGQRIGTVGSTGNSTGPHLHLTIKLRGATEAGLTSFPRDIVDPTDILANAHLMEPPV